MTGKSLDQIGTQWRLGAAILKNSGFKVFLHRGLHFAGAFFFTYEKFYVYRVKTDAVTTSYSVSEGVEFKIIRNLADYSALSGEGYDFASFVVKEDVHLKAGAACLCFFQQKVIRDVAWIAADSEAKENLIDVPCRVSFESGESYLGRFARNSKISKPYYPSITLYYKALEVLRGMGRTACVFVVLRDNLGPQIGLGKRGGILPYAEGSYLKILFWRWWRERPLRSQPEHLLRFQRAA